MSSATHDRSGYRAGYLLWLAWWLCFAGVGCGGGNNALATLSVAINPSSVTLLVNGTQQFVATVLSGQNLASDQTVKWLVNDVEGGNSTIGTITTAGVYTAPATVPGPANVTVKAVANLDPKPSATATVTVDSGVHISVSPGSATVGTSETFQFLASVTGTTTTDVNWLVNDVAGGNDTVGTISASGLYMAPSDVPSPATVTIKATAQADTSKSATASAAIVTAVDPTLSSISPTTAAQGSLFQDVYLNGSDFISTTKVLFNNQVISSDQITALSGGGLLRVRTPATLLSTAGVMNVRVQRQSQPSTGCSPECQLTITPARPAVVGASPDSVPETGVGPTSINVNGGYFGAGGSSINAFFGTDSGMRVVDSSASTPRQARVNLNSGDFGTLGLAPLTLRNAASAQLVASTNLAVQPATAEIAGSAIGVGNAPGAVAINTGTGIAVVANRLSDSISLINLASPGPPTNVALSGASGPFAPTGVAVDNLTNRAVVANSGNNTISIVDLATNAVTTINASIFNAPNSVGVNPLTGLALVAYKSTNVASIIDLKLSPPAVIGTVTVAAGPNPQVAIEPRLNWAVVTPGAIPGGPGSLAIVDLGRQSSNGIASNGASRSGGIVTITTTAAHSVQIGQAVLITGVSDTSFNGYFTVASIPSSTTFTYSQAGANASSGGGLVRYSNPLATFALSSGVAGISINPETEKAVVADPNTNTLSVLSILDQSVSSLALTDGCANGVVCAVATAVNPLTNTAVSVDQFLNTASIIDPGSAPPRVITTVPVGNGPKAVAIDPGSNLAVVANETANSVSIIRLAATATPFRPLQITQIAPPAALRSAGAPLTLTILGKGFAPGAVVRLDGVALPAPSSITDRQITVSVPANPFLSSARRFALDVVSGANRSNVADFAVIQAVPLGDDTCGAPAPRGLAVDPQRDVAVVANPGCNTISLVSTNSGAVTSTIAVGSNPQGVAVIPRLGKAVVTNRGDGTASGTASIVSLDDGSICDSCTPTVGSEPLGVAINQDTAMAVVANSTDSSAGNSVSVFSADTGGSVTTVSGLNRRPVALAIDSARNKAAVASATENLVDLLDLSQPTPSITARISTGSLPTGVAFDPSTNLFIATPSLTNTVAIVNADTQQSSALRIGINPTSVAYNFQASTLVTLNSASNTVSVVDFLDRRTRAVLSFAVVQGLSPAPSCIGFLGSSGNQQPPCGVDIHPRTNLAVIADGDNHRVLLVPLPR